MNYHVIRKYDAANGKGVRTSIFFTGCSFHCESCFNHDIWDFRSGKLFDDKAKQEVMENLADVHVSGLSVLGGEPLQQNLEELFSFLREVKEKYPQKDIWLWTGYYLNELNEERMKVVLMCDYIVDGRFEQPKKQMGLRFRGSSNQTIWEKTPDGDFVRSKLND